MVEKHSVPLVTIEVAVKTGSFTERPETNGLSHLYEHMFFKGNAALPSQERYMARVAKLGISFNGTTSTERVNYFFTLPARNFAAGMQFMADALLTPLFNEEELQKERQVVIGEYDRNEATPTHYLWEGLRERLYGPEAYRKNPLGERAVILSAGRETMHAFRRRFYLPNNACLLVVGDVNPTEVRVHAERLFGPRSWARGPDPHDPPRPPLWRLPDTRSFVTVQETPLLMLGAQWPGPDVGRDERATFVADVWGTLCALPHARFQKTVREAQVADRASLSYYTQREGGELQFSGVVREGRLVALRDLVLAEIAAMAEPGYWSAAELALAQRTLRINRAYEGESGARLAHTLSFWWASSSVDYYRRYLEETDAVTLDELQALARNYLLGRPFVLGALCNAENQAALDLSAETLLPPPQPGVAASSAVEEFVLDSGAQVILRRVPGAGVTALQLFVDGGCLDLRPEQQGIDKLLWSSILDGSRQTPRDALQAALVGLGARSSQDANYDYSRISLIAPAEGFPRAIELLGECLREPAFETESVEQRRSQILTILGAEQGNPDSYVVRVLNGIFFAEHPYRLRPDGTPATVGELSEEQLRARLQELLVGGRLTLVLVGDLERAAARELLEQAFGFIPPGAWTRAETPAFSPSGLVARDPREIPTTYLLGKCPAPAPGHADYPATKLALALLRQRLWETLRTQHALTYAPSAGLSHYRSNYASIYASTTHPARVVELMHTDIGRLRDELVVPEKLQGIVTQEETRAYAGDEAAMSHALGLGHAQLVAGSWRTHYERPRAYARVTPAEIRRVAREYLHAFRFGFIGPGEVPEPVLRGEALAEAHAPD